MRCEHPTQKVVKLCVRGARGATSGGGPRTVGARTVDRRFRGRRGLRQKRQRRRDGSRRCDGSGHTRLESGRIQVRALARKARRRMRKHATWGDS